MPRPAPRWRELRILAALMAMLLTLVAASAASESAVASPGWSIQPTPSLAGPPQGVLYGVSCTTTACFAVGDYVNTAGTRVPLVEQWNGTSWSAQTTPALPGDGVLYGVSCTATRCTTVGYETDGSGAEVTLAEQWNGSGWAIEPAATLSGAARSVLSGVSCTSDTACIAVGYWVNASGTGQTLAEEWNGSSWSQQPTATPAAGGDLARVSCSAWNACTALGQASGTTLSYRWNGSAWSAQTIAIPTGATSTELYGITCTGSTLCTAVGHWREIRCNNGQPTCNCFRWPGCTFKQGTLIEQWTGSAWTVQSAFGGAATMYDVSCTTSACTAVGTNGGNGTWAEQGSGANWTVQTTPTPAGGGSFQGVACTTATACVAVGQGNGATLAEGWNGSAWTIQPTPNPPGPGSSGFSGVSCPSVTACTAVGSYTNTSGTQVPLAEQWDGTRWTVPSHGPMSPSGAASSSLSAVSCTAASCTATGTYATPVGGNPPPDFALAEKSSNGDWAIQSTASLVTGYNSVLSGVSCTAGTPCMAVGYDYLNQGPQDAPLAEQWTGNAWVLAPAQASSGAFSSALSSASCATATVCIAVGVSGLSDPLSEQWNGTSWTIQPTPAGGSLSGVSCPTANVCIAVGGLGTPVADEWNGSSWTSQAVPLPSGNNGGQLSSVSCTSAADCTAVGNYNPSTGGEMTLAEHWDGTAWTIERTPNPAGAIGSYLTGVSCPAAAACTAVGQYQNTSNMRVTLAEHYS